MSKKNFKDSAAHLDRFFSEPETSGTQGTQRTSKPHRTHRTHKSAEPDGSARPEREYYRLNLKLRAEFRDYLENASWSAKKSITQYLNDLIAADMGGKS